MNTIATSEIELLFKLVINKLRADKVSHVEIPGGEYWQIPTDQWSDFEIVPDPVVCSLEDDFKYLKEAIKDLNISSYSDFDRLASLLRKISETLAPSTK